MGDGGVHIDLDEMNRLEAEKQEKEAAEAAAKAEQDKKDAFLARRSELLWAYNLYVLGSGPAALALVTMLSGPLVRHLTAADSCQQLRHFVSLSIFTAWVYLFLYNWMIMGPLPFKGKLKPLKVVFAVLSVWSVVVYSLGGAFVMMWPACADESPLEYRYCQMQVYMFLFAGVATLIKFAKEKYAAKSLERRKAKKAEMKAKMKAEQEAAEAAEDEEDEEEEDNNGDGEEEEGGEGEEGGEDEEEEEEDDEDDEDEEEGAK